MFRDREIDPLAIPVQVRRASVGPTHRTAGGGPGSDEELHQIIQLGPGGHPDYHRAVEQLKHRQGPPNFDEFGDELGRALHMGGAYDQYPLDVNTQKRVGPGSYGMPVVPRNSPFATPYNVGDAHPDEPGAHQPLTGPGINGMPIVPKDSPFATPYNSHDHSQSRGPRTVARKVFADDGGIDMSGGIADSTAGTGMPSMDSGVPSTPAPSGLGDTGGGSVAPAGASSGKVSGRIATVIDRQAREFLAGQNTDDRSELLYRARRHAATQTSTWTPNASQRLTEAFCERVGELIPRATRKAAVASVQKVADFDDMLLY